MQKKYRLSALLEDELIGSHCVVFLAAKLRWVDESFLFFSSEDISFDVEPVNVKSTTARKKKCRKNRQSQMRSYLNIISQLFLWHIQIGSKERSLISLKISRISHPLNELCCLCKFRCLQSIDSCCHCCCTARNGSITARTSK